jgi:FRG domain-containing protein
MNNILDVVMNLRESDPPLTYLGKDESVAYGKSLEFEVVDWNGKTRIVPSEALNLPGRPGKRSFMYRGQIERYPTCGPSILRGAPDDEWQIKARLSLERFRVAELELVLRDHPFKAVLDKRGFWVDYHSLAQHYGIPTSLLDLTSNVEVAAFFAVAKWDKESASFKPMETGTGVIYLFDWTAFGPGYSKFFEPVGFGPGLRPARQHAWTFRLRPGVDFQQVAHVAAIEFAHSKAASEELFARFDCGAWLYPPDCLASLVEKLRDLPFVTMHAIRHAARQDGQPSEEIESNAEKAAHFLNATLGLGIVDGHELQPEEEDLEIARSQASALGDALDKLRFGLRLVRTRREPSDDGTAQ